MENKNNKNLVVVLIIIIAVMFMTIVGLSISLVVQKVKCNLATRIYNTVDKTVDNTKDTTDKILDNFGKVFDIITKESNGVSFPQIDYDSQDVEEINDDIEEFINGLTKNDNFSFKIYDNGDIESVVIRNSIGDTANYIYKVYNVNKKTGKKVTSEDLLKQKNLDIDKVKIRMKAIWMQKVKSSEGYSMPTNSNPNVSVEQATKDNIDKLTNDNIVLYLNNDGHLCVIYEEYQIAGSEKGFYIMDLDKYLYTDLK